MTPFLIALQFLTRLPIRLAVAPDERLVGRSLLYYPLVGLMLGLLLATVNWALADAPALLRAALVLTAWVTLTGALHLDGLADSADAWIGGFGNRERTLAIMKDPYCGPTAVVALVIVLLIKFSALHSLTPNDWLSIILVSALARSLVPLLFLTTPYARTTGLGAEPATHQARVPGMLVAAATWIGAVLIAGTKGIMLVSVALVTFLVLRRAMVKRLGGTTGDTAGALIEITESTTLVASAVWG